MESRPPKLLDQLHEAIRARHYSIRTQNVYCDWARRFILFHDKRHPRDMAADEVTAFLTHLANERSVSASTQNHWKGAPACPARRPTHLAGCVEQRGL
ncbi:MAG: phage integrase N-terminal SAM-like domain-containing protein [Rhodanobacter sp.]|nr:phage integrase N-terminal SAM-like domain-containing protein [Rhodanobacter sp.]